VDECSGPLQTVTVNEIKNHIDQCIWDNTRVGIIEIASEVSIF
jgi:hypothetical protein